MTHGQHGEPSRGRATTPRPQWCASPGWWCPCLASNSSSSSPSLLSRPLSHLLFLHVLHAAPPPPGPPAATLDPPAAPPAALHALHALHAHYPTVDKLPPSPQLNEFEDILLRLLGWGRGRGGRGDGEGGRGGVRGGGGGVSALSSCLGFWCWALGCFLFL